MPSAGLILQRNDRPVNADRAVTQKTFAILPRRHYTDARSSGKQKEMREIMGTTVKKHEIDMLHGSIWNKLPLFALPVAATAILEQLFHASDVAIVGNFTGDARTVAVAAVGANGPIIGLIVNLFIGIALGANVVIANAIGCRDDNAVKRAVHTAIVFAVCGGAAVALLGQLIASPAFEYSQCAGGRVPLCAFVSAHLSSRHAGDIALQL